MGNDEYNVSVAFTGKNNLSGTASTVTTDLNRVARGARDAGDSMGPLERNVNRVRQAMELGIAGAMLSKVNQFSQEFYALGASVNAAEQTFQALVSPMGNTERIMERLRTATGGVVGDLTLMQGANQFASMGIATTATEMERLVQMAVRLGGAMGHDAKQSVSDFAAMLANESIPRLDTFGIASGRVRERIDELLASGEAASRSEAFRMAVLEEGTTSLNRLGDAALAAETPLARLQTQLDNIAQTGASNFAVGVNAIIDNTRALLDWRSDNIAVTEEAERRLQAERGLGYNQYDLENMIQQIRLEQQYGEQIEASIRGVTRGLNEQVEIYRQRERSAEAAVVAEQRRTQHIGQAEGQLQHLRDSFRRFGGTAELDMLGNWDYNVEFADASKLQNTLNALMQIRSQLALAQGDHEAGLISDADLERVESAAATAEALAAALQEGAEAFEHMTLGQALGEGAGNELLGGIGDQVLAALRERGELDAAALQASADAYNLAADRITQSSLTMRDTIVPILARLAETQGINLAVERSGQVEDFMRNAALMGMNPNGLGMQLGMSLSTGTILGIDVQGLIVEPFAAAFDEVREDVMGLGGETDNGAAVLSGLPDGVNKAIEAVDALDIALEEISLREYEIKIRVIPDDPNGLLTGSTFVAGAGAGGGGGTVTRDQVDMRGRSTNSRRLTPTRS